MALKFLHRLRVHLLGGLIPEGKTGIKILGHRNYVGGRWDEIGKFQFDYIVSRGLKPDDCFLDIACGALRGGQHFINYLEKGNYLGIDREDELIQIGIEKELGRDIFEEKAPKFVVSSAFEFEKFAEFDKKPQYALALSLFTHLTLADIELCLRNLRAFVDPGHQFYATFFEGDSSTNMSKSHSLDHFEYSSDEFAKIGERHGWEPTYIGDWNHPRNQMMMLFTAA